MREQWKQWQTFLGSKTTADGEHSHEIKKRLLLGRKAMTNLDSTLKMRAITFLIKFSLRSFSSSHVWTWELDQKESWVPKNWCFWTYYWRRLLRVPWTARRSNQSILKVINPEYSLEELMLKLKLQYFGDFVKSWRIGKDPNAGKDWTQKEKRAAEDDMVR